MKKILIVEDDQSLASAYRAKFSDQYETNSAINGVQGIKLARSWQPDFIILDLFLPEKSGREVLRDLKKHKSTKQIPVMVLTNVEGQCDQMLKLGAVDCFIKTSVTMEEIVQKINGYLV